MDDGGVRSSAHASSALAAVSTVLVLLYLFWRFIWQAKKHATSTGATTATSPSPPLPSCHREGPAWWLARETSRSPLFLRVEVPAAGAGCGVEEGDCAVCLAELRDGEAAARLGLVPGCGHAFHVECIEAWFRVNSTCPLCRAAVAAAGQGAGSGSPRCSSV